jgi:hypothetical protein
MEPTKEVIAEINLDNLKFITYEDLTGLAVQGDEESVLSTKEVVVGLLNIIKFLHKGEVTFDD